MSVITISGSQGQGKTTVLNALRDMGCQVVEKKTSRSILSEWGLTLNEVNRYPPLTRMFQDEIMRRHTASMKPYIDDGGLTLMERSFADIFTYAVLAIGSFNEYNTWLEDYWSRCVEEQAKYHAIIHLTGRTFIPEDDGVRSTGRFFGELVDREIAGVLVTMDGIIKKQQLVTVSATSLEDRVNAVLAKTNGARKFGERFNA